MERREKEGKEKGHDDQRLKTQTLLVPLWSRLQRGSCFCVLVLLSGVCGFVHGTHWEAFDSVSLLQDVIAMGSKNLQFLMPNPH